MAKNPHTGRRVSRINLRPEWIKKEAPELRIVPQDVFEAAQKRRAERGGPKPHQKRKPRHLFSGLLRCGCCGAGMSVKDNDHGRISVVCTQANEAGTCENKRPYYLDQIEATVLSGLKQELRKPEAIKLYVQSYNDEMKRLSANSSSASRKLENRLIRVKGELNRAIDALLRGIVEPDDVREKIASLKQEKKDVEVELNRIDASKTPVVCTRPQWLLTCVAWITSNNP